jgi:hypothetical protein
MHAFHGSGNTKIQHSPGRRTAGEVKMAKMTDDDDDARSWRPIVVARHEQKPQSLG